MKDITSDQDILDLLSSLKNSENEYPANMIRSRREMFVKQAAAMVVLPKAGATGTSSETMAGSSHVVTSGSAGAGSVGTLLQTLLIIAIVVEAGITAYFFRDEITEFIHSNISPKVEVVVTPPEGTSPEIPARTEIPFDTLTVTETDTPTPTPQPSPAINSNNALIGTSNVDGNEQGNSTPTPNDHPGLHLGQTKQPTKTP
jgi:hypothetical protein